MSMIFISSAFPEVPSLSVALRICECKSKTLFFNDQMFLKKILKFFLSNLNPSQTLNLSTPALRFIRTAKIQTLFYLTTLFAKSFKVFFRLSLVK